MNMSVVHMCMPQVINKQSVPLLLHCLHSECYGMCGEQFQGLTTYLSDRKQRLQISFC